MNFKSFFSLLLCAFPLFALDKVSVQLKWHHQFQFAGYYAAVEQGYYRDEGLEVTLIDRNPAINNIEQVLNGESQYGIADSALLVYRAQNKPLVIVAPIFQHSPSVLITLKSSGIDSPYGLVGKRVELYPNDVDGLPLLAMLHEAGITKKGFSRIETHFDSNQLVSKNVDATHGYSTNEPYALKEKGVEVNVIYPQNFGVDFYGDMLFTTEEEDRRHPKRVEAMKRATIKGWEYAIAHPQEMIRLIQTTYGSTQSTSKLMFEANGIIAAIAQDAFPVGTLNKGRLDYLHNMLVRHGLVNSHLSLNQRIYRDASGIRQKLLEYISLDALAYISALFLLILFILTYYMRTLQKQKKALRDLTQELERHKYALDEHSIVSATDIKGNITFLNKSFERLSGYSYDELIGKNHRLLNSGHHPSSFWEEMYAMVGRGEAWHGTVCDKAKDGRLYWVETTILPFLDEAKKPKSYIAIRTDITRQVEIGHALLDTNKQLSNISENIPGVIYTFELFADGRSCFPYASEHIYDIYGVTPEEVSKDAAKVFAVLHPEDLEHVAQTIRDSHDKLSNWKAQYRVNHPQKGLIWVQGIGQPEKQPEGSVLWYGYIYDITESKNASIALEESETKYKSLIENTPGIAYRCKFDEDWTMLFMSKAVDTITGYESDAFIGNKEISYGMLIVPEDSKYAEQIVARAIEKNELWEVEYRIRHKDGTIRYVYEKGRAALDKNGNVEYLDGFLLDVTERKEAQVALETAKEAAEASTRAKSEFLAAMSHEIRTPMNGVLGMLGLLEKTRLNATQQHQVEVATSSATSLLGLINDILDFSKIEAGKMNLERHAFDLRDELEDFVKSIAFKAEEKGLKLILDTDQIRHANIITDPGRLRQILTNLIANAVKFTHEGKITIKASVHKDRDNHGHLRIDIIDTGIGIPAEKIEMLFEAFTQADGSTTRKYGGTGLGLSIVKKLCELMGGSVSATSTPGAGSTFSLDLYLELGSAHLITKKAEEDSRYEQDENFLWPPDTRILLVEDNLTNQLVAQGMLENIGLECDIAANGLEALEAIRISHDAQGYTLVLMDCQMPEMDGYDATRAVRRGDAGQENKGLRIIAMTANAMQGDREKCIDAGMDDYIPKPINPSVLKSTLVKWIFKGELSEHLNDEHVLMHEDPSTDLPLWDEADALHRLGGNSALLRKIIDSFMNDAVKSLTGLAKALEENSSEDAQLHAHSLKGSAGNVGALKLQAIAKHLEQEAKNKNITKVQAGFEKCENTLNATLKIFEAHEAKELNPDARKKQLDPLQVAIYLQNLKRKLEKGMSIDPEATEIFMEYGDETLSQKMAKLKAHIERFESDAAITLLDQIMADLH